MSHCRRGHARAADEAGASGGEYALLVTAIAAAVVIVVFLLGDVVTELFSDSCNTVHENFSGHGTTSATADCDG